MYFHLVCSPEFFAVASSKKSTRKVFHRSRELMVLKDHEFGRNLTSPPMSFIHAPFMWAYHFAWGRGQWGCFRQPMGFASPSRLRAQTLTLWPCEHERKKPNTMLTRPKALGHFRFWSQLNDGSTQFNAYQNSIFERGQVLVEK